MLSERGIEKLKVGTHTVPKKPRHATSRGERPAASMMLYMVRSVVFVGSFSERMRVMPPMRRTGYQVAVSKELLRDRIEQNLTDRQNDEHDPPCLPLETMSE